MNLVLLVASAWAVDREATLDHAAAYAAHEWTMTAENESADCSDDYECDYTAGTYRGLPYDWGGYVTLEEYDQDLLDGLAAGSHSWHGVLSCTTGVDCSGFLSKTWETGHYSTSTFSSVTSNIDASDLLRGDAINDAGSHVVLYTHETNAGQPIFYEATSGSANKVRLNANGGWAYVNGYQPIRYDEMQDGSPTGTKDSARQIVSFPYEDFRWTAGAASDSIDSYSCAPSTDESGPEVLYVFSAATAGTLHVVVSDDAAVDVDVHVMTEPNGESCLARDDSEVEVAVEPGEVWISVDTYVSGNEFPGPFLLTATFTGEAGDPPETLDTDDDTTAIEGGLHDRKAVAHGCGCNHGAAGMSAFSLLPLWMLRRRRGR